MVFLSLSFSRQLRLVALATVLVVMPVAIAGCGGNRTEQKLAQDAKDLQGENFDTDLTFNAVTLEDFDQKGRLWWRVKADQASYSRDKKIARIKQPRGEFYQDGKAIIKVSAESGEVFQDGKHIFLRGKIVATDTRDGLVMRGNEMEWRPQEELVLIRNNVSGNRKNVKASATVGKYLTRARRLELDGKVIAESQNPNVRFNTERLVWLVEKQKLQGDRALQVERFKDKTITDRASAAKGEMDLKTEVVTLIQTAQLNTLDPPIQVNGNLIVWKLKQQLISSTQPITITNSKQGVTLTGNQGDLDLKTKILTLVGNVNGGGGPRQSQIQSDRLVWNIDTQAFQANGNVVYRQAKPPLNLSGPTASGDLKNQQVVVSGGRVVTEFVP